MQSKKIEEKNYNRDPITGEPGSHPIGTTLGAGAGAVAGATAGASIGAAVGPGGAAIGAVTGAIIGGLGGGAAGGEIAEYVDPTAEEAFWESSYQSRPYVEPGQSYDTYRSAYRYGYDSRARTMDRSFNDVEAELERDWPNQRQASSLEWPQARDAVRDAYDRTGSEYARRIKENAAASRTGNVIGSASGTVAGMKNASSSTAAPSNTNTPRDPRKTSNA